MRGGVILLIGALASSAASKRKKRKMRGLEEYTKSELSESRDMCKQCEFVVARLAGHLMADAEDPARPATSVDGWRARFPRYCEPLNTPACLRFLELHSPTLAHELSELSAEVQELGEDEPSLTNANLRERLCSDLTGACQPHHRVVRRDEFTVVVRNLLGVRATLMYLARDEAGAWVASVPDEMRLDSELGPGGVARLYARAGHQFVALPAGAAEADAARLAVRANREEQFFELRDCRRAACPPPADESTAAAAARYRLVDVAAERAAARGDL